MFAVLSCTLFYCLLERAYESSCCLPVRLRRGGGERGVCMATVMWDVVARLRISANDGACS